MSALDDIAGAKGYMVLGDLKAQMSREAFLGMYDQEQEVIGFGEVPEDAILMDGGKSDDDKQYYKKSGMLECLGLPSQLMSFALTYAQAYSSSSVFTDGWTAERTVSRIDMPHRKSSRIDMPLRVRHRPKTKLEECLTCKVRRVKCDELKPTCLRCQKLGIECSGYYTPQRESTRSQSKVQRRPVAPRLLLSIPQSLLGMSILHSDRKHHHFKVFSQRLHRDGRHGVLLQIFQMEPVIRTAAIACAALEDLNAATNESQKSKRRDNLSLDQVQEQRFKMSDGIQQNVVSVKQIRDTRKLLLTSFYMACFKDISSNHGLKIREALLMALTHGRGSSNTTEASERRNRHYWFITEFKGGYD